MHQTAYFPNKKKLKKKFWEGSQLPPHIPPYWVKETPLPAYSLTPEEKGKVGAYDNLILYQEHALKKALILL